MIFSQPFVNSIYFCLETKANISENCSCLQELEDTHQRSLQFLSWFFFSLYIEVMVYAYFFQFLLDLPPGTWYTDWEVMNAELQISWKLFINCWNCFRKIAEEPILLGAWSLPAFLFLINKYYCYNKMGMNSVPSNEKQYILDKRCSFSQLTN